MKRCVECIHFKYGEEVFDGYIEHKLDNGEVWLKEPKRKRIPCHCPLHQEIFEKYWEHNKNFKQDDPRHTDVDCDDYDIGETRKMLQKMIELASDILKTKNNGSKEI